MHRHLLAVASLLAFAAPAAAQTANSGFTGLYAGGHVGVGYVDNDRPAVLFDTNRDGSFGDTVRTGTGANAFSPGFCDGRALGTTPNSGCNNGDSGREHGAHVGFDADVGGFVAGLVAEYNRHDLKDSVSAFSTTPASYTLTRRLRDSVAVRARAGVVANGSSLLYATGGLVQGRFRHSFVSSNTANAFAVTDRSTRGRGYQLGGGIDQRIGRNFSIGLLYLYSNIKDRGDSRIDVTRGTAPATNPFVLTNPAGTFFERTDERFRSHSGRVSASVRF
jgi:outer membrane immunogenic protein